MCLQFADSQSKRHRPRKQCKQSKQRKQRKQRKERKQSTQRKQRGQSIERSVRVWVSTCVFHERPSLLTPQDTTVASDKDDQLDNEVVAQSDSIDNRTQTMVADGDDSMEDSESSVEDFELTREQEWCGHGLETSAPMMLGSNSFEICWSVRIV